MNITNNSLASTTVSRVPIKNIWLLLLYASDCYRTIGKKLRVDLENNPEQLIDLTAKLFCKAVNERLSHSLYFDYQKKIEVLNRVRGKIDILATTRKQLLEKGKIQCHYEDLIIDTPQNRYIHAAAHKLLKQLNNDKLIEQSRKIINQFTALKIGQSTNYNYLTEQFNKSNRQDRTLLSLANLIFTLSIPTELPGLHQFEQVEKTDNWLRTLFEKAIVGFAHVNFDKKQWKIESRKRHYWQHELATSNIKYFFPTMQTDLIIEHRTCKHRLIIDTKCTSILKCSRYREKVFDRNHIFQLYSYLRSQETHNDVSSLHSSGMLLYPTINTEVNESVVIQNHKFRFCTINLAQESVMIREKLFKLLCECSCK